MYTVNSTSLKNICGHIVGNIEAIQICDVPYFVWNHWTTILHIWKYDCFNSLEDSTFFVLSLLCSISFYISHCVRYYYLRLIFIEAHWADIPLTSPLSLLSLPVSFCPPRCFLFYFYIAVLCQSIYTNYRNHKANLQHLSFRGWLD